jgi:Tfp pilus assembly ATPase PilU
VAGRVGEVRRQAIQAEAFLGLLRPVTFHAVAVEEGTNEGLQTFDQALLDLFQRKIVGQEDAVRFADSPNNLRLRMKGIR